MSALLSDGVSAKGGNASGTFGNGHSVVVPASNLRFVLYGGLTVNGESYGAGQAVLASHRVDGKWRSRSGRGVYLESFKPSSADVAVHPGTRRRHPPDGRFGHRTDSR